MNGPTRRTSLWPLLLAPALLLGCTPADAPAIGHPAASVPHVADAPPGTEASGDAAPVEVDRDAPVSYRDGEVRTPCYRYLAPDPSWTLVPGSAGCSTGVAFGDDRLSVVQVHAVAATGTLDELAARTVEGDPEAVIEPVRLGGYEGVRAVSSSAVSAVPVASVVIAYPDPGLTGGGNPLTAIVVSAASGPEFDRFVELVVASLLRPDGTPI